jgi:hypothetical protein
MLSLKSLIFLYKIIDNRCDVVLGQKAAVVMSRSIGDAPDFLLSRATSVLLSTGIHFLKKKKLYVLIFQCKYTRELTFENLCHELV